MCIPTHATILAQDERRPFADMMTSAAPAPIPSRSTTSGATVPGSLTQDLHTKLHPIPGFAIAEEVLCHG
jgi:hypothetical protein